MRSAIAFDFDGVFVDSNNLKVCSIVDHIFNTGKSRFNTKSDLEDFIRLNFGHGREYLISESLINKSDLSLIRSILNNLLLNLDPLYLQLDIISRNSIFNLLKLLRQDFDLYIISGSSKSSINHILGEDKFVFRDILSCRDGQNKVKFLSILINYKIYYGMQGTLIVIIYQLLMYKLSFHSSQTILFAQKSVFSIYLQIPIIYLKT